ncbi:MAG: VOC family protein [Bradyrhizobium sp.]|uniref:VOC family protein n=1 Tax=Bradyrhizobium sp. TaxID=376 RepID=UPI001C29F9F8|nr:VOC family protein [Bradyrhizobium sp.]MBU6463419.1 VOC family protein [Pseudomonadota bacterium]MDE2067093.1 VOC family protein [Bradyrhizobium sp.]MDE2242340.1 VOC family protein [Bradyrhizobium sp.]MDE2468067.1 VOC family protein [Bradyrhizobium sp.]
MPHGLDHIVHVVRDLEASADFYLRAGFMVSARNRHPWGTHNRIVQLGNAYIELLEVAEPEKIPPHGRRSFSFGAFNRDFLAAREGLSMLILGSSNAAADADEFEAAGIGAFDVFDFSRQGKRPDGSEAKLAFSLAFAQDAASLDVGFAACQHHFPQNFWNPAFQIHANGAKTMPGVVLVADNPADHHIFLKAFTGLRDLHSNSLGIKAVTENGDVEIMEEVAFRDRTGVAIKPGRVGMTLDALRVAVADIAAVEILLREAGIAASRRQFRGEIGRLVLPPELAFGATLIFEAAKPA